MADVTPDWQVEIQRKRMELAGFRHNVERFRLQIMEHESRAKEARANIVATEEAMAEYEARLADLLATHGDGQAADEAAG